MLQNRDSDRYISMSDQELLEEMKKGSEGSFDILHRRYAAAIYRFVYHLVGRRETAQDITQEVFMRLSRKASMYKPTGTFSSWLYRMARNLTIDFFRTHSHIQRERPLERSPEDTCMTQAVEDILSRNKEEASDIVIADEQKEFVKRCLLRLKPRDRQIIYLCDIQEMPHKEAADIIGMPPTHINTELARARERFKKIVGLKNDFI